MWSKLTVSASDFALNLIVALIGTSGLLWLTGSGQTYNPSTSLEKIQAQLDDKSKENGDLRDRSDKAKSEADALEADVENTMADHPDPDASEQRRKRAEEALARSQDEATRLDEELRQLLLLKEEIQQEEHQSEQARKESEALKKKLLAKTHEVAFQREELAKIKREEIKRPIVPINIVPRFSTDERKPVFVLLNQGTVTPVREPNFSMTQVDNGRRAKLVSRGKAVDLALSAGSDFQNLLGQINTQEQYVFFLVDSSSYETFRAVREELRRRVIPLGWAPMNGTTFTFVSGTSDGALEPGVSK